MNKRRGFPPLRQKQRRRKDGAPIGWLRMTVNLEGRDREAVGTRLRASRWPNWRATGPGLPSTSSIIGRLSGGTLRRNGVRPAGALAKKWDAITRGVLTSCDMAHHHLRLSQLRRDQWPAARDELAHVRADRRQSLA